MAVIDYQGAPIEMPCTLCGVIRKKSKFKQLYGQMVCKKCLYAFANRRQLAYIADNIIWAILLNIVLTALAYGLVAVGVDRNIVSLVGFLGWPAILIFFCKDGFGGKSLGKWLAGVTVFDQNSRLPIGFMASFKRNLCLLIPFAALVAAFQLNNGPRLGDKWANTMVVWDRYKSHPIFTSKPNCEKCGYNLQGNLSGTCPECGTPISEANHQRLAQLPPIPAPIIS